MGWELEWEREREWGWEREREWGRGSRSGGVSVGDAST